MLLYRIKLSNCTLHNFLNFNFCVFIFAKKGFCARYCEISRYGNISTLSMETIFNLSVTNDVTCSLTSVEFCTVCLNWFLCLPHEFVNHLTSLYIASHLHAKSGHPAQMKCNFGLISFYVP